MNIECEDEGKLSNRSMYDDQGKPFGKVVQMEETRDSAYSCPSPYCCCIKLVNLLGQSTDKTFIVVNINLFNIIHFYHCTLNYIRIFKKFSAYIYFK